MSASTATRSCFPRPQARRQCRPAGEDIPSGFAALKSGQRLRPQDVALVAAFGMKQLDVVRRIRVAVFSTGNELASPGEVRAAPQLFDSNRFMLMAMLARLGCHVSDLGILRDDRAALSRALQDVAGDHDLILTTGGVSTGEEDHVKASVESIGRLVLWRMAIKPGRPVAMGIIGGTPFIGLPGNPVASFVTFVHVVRPTVLALSGARPEPLLPMPVRAAFSYKKKNRAPRICPRHPAQGRRWRARSGEISARRCGLVVLAGGHLTAWSNSAKKSRRSRPARRSASCPMRASIN
jgi:molybdenum cofactor synthesis domain-containing protein